DVIQNAISQLVGDGRLDRCDAINVRIELLEMLKRLAHHVIKMINPEFFQNKGIMITQEDIYYAYNKGHEVRLQRLRDERQKPGCGDGGGTTKSGQQAQAGNV